MHTGRWFFLWSSVACVWWCLVSVYYFPTEDDDDEDGPTFMEKAIEAARKGIDIFCVWDCCQPWLTLQSWISFIVFDPFVELFITLCIVVNTLFMALDHHDMDRYMEKILKRGNYVSISETIFLNRSVAWCLSHPAYARGKLVERGNGI